MPSPTYFTSCPPFPKDAIVADIPTLSLTLLEQGDERESTRLFNAGRHYGFFALNLEGSEQGMSLVCDAEHMFDLAHETLNLDKATLGQYACKPPKDLMGYKQAGVMKTENGQFDAVEVYTLSQDDILGTTTPRAQPEPIQRRRMECREFFKRTYQAVAVILNALDVKLGLPKGTLAHLTAPNRESATASRFLLTRPQDSDVRRICFGGHTDIGIITILFHIAGGLQILPAECDNKDENWRYVRPQAHCALVNLGDTLVELTGGVLRSSLHRVVTAPGEQAHVERISLAYLVRPARAETMRRLAGDGNVIPPQKGDAEAPSVDAWAAEQALAIMKGVVKPRTKGGAPIVVN